MVKSIVKYHQWSTQTNPNSFANVVKLEVDDKTANVMHTKKNVFSIFVTCFYYKILITVVSKIKK